MLFVIIATFIPWLLLKGAISVRALAVGAVLFAVAMMTLRPFTQIWLTHSVELSAERYGSIGVAFTYLAWLYLIAWTYLATAVLGQVMVTDPGPLGTKLSGGKDPVRQHRVDSVERVLVDDEP